MSSKKKLTEKYLSVLSERYVMGLIEIENLVGVKMVNVTKVEMETDEHVWTITVNKSPKLKSICVNCGDTPCDGGDLCESCLQNQTE